MTTHPPATARHFDEVAKIGWNAAYEAAHEESIWAALPFLERAVAEFGKAPPGPVLEVPCGGGRNTVPLAEGLPAVLAVDASPLALDIAGRVLRRAGVSNCVLMQGDIFSLPFPAQVFSGVFCADLLGHLRRRREALAELLRVCRPGGRIVANFFALEDSTRRDPDMARVGDTEFLFRGDVYFRYDTHESVGELVDLPSARIVSTCEERWREDGHAGYRDYPHDHHSIVVVLERL